MSAPTAEHADAQHDASIQAELLRNAYNKANDALGEAEMLRDRADTPEHRKLVHRLSVVVDELDRELGVKR